MSLRDDIEIALGEENFQKTILNIEDAINEKKLGLNNLKNFSKLFLFIGIFFLVSPSFWIIGCVLLFITMITIRLKNEAKEIILNLNELLYLMTHDVENTQENYDRFLFLIDQL